jgi:hypothetical protein
MAGDKGVSNLDNDPGTKSALHLVQELVFEIRIQPDLLFPEFSPLKP